MPRDNNYRSSGNNGTQEKNPEIEAKALVRSQRTMVLATAADDLPWAAPVYYVYHKAGFYFFSNPSSRHIRQCLLGQAAAVIFSDSDRWEQIQGLQMQGRIKLISKTTTIIHISARFVIKFPFAEPFLRIEPPSGKSDGHGPALSRKVSDRVKLFGFFPSQIYYVNNTFGFGTRISIQLKDTNKGV